MSRSEPFVIQEQDCPVEGSADSSPGAVRWWTLLSRDRTPTDSLTAGIAELEAGGAERFRPHRHAQPEIYHILSGTGVVSVEGRDHPVEPGHTVFIPGGALHGARSTGAGPLRLFYVFPCDSFDEVRYEFPEP